MIIDWRWFAEGIAEAELSKEDRNLDLAYIREWELWEPRNRSEGSRKLTLLEQVKQYFFFLRYGGVPEDSSGPLQPYLKNRQENEPKCLGEAVCDLIEEQKLKTNKSEKGN